MKKSFLTINTSFNQSFKNLYLEFVLFQIQMMPTKEKVILDFEYFIQSAIKKELSWKSLAYFLTDLSTTMDKSKQVIRALVQELEVWVLKVESEKNEVEDFKEVDDGNEVETSGVHITEDHEQIHMSEENMSDILTSDSYTSDFEIERIGNKIMEDIPSSIGIENEIEVLDVNKESIRVCGAI